ncbi:lipooligosaccharide biosynthesis glycosyltransferase [Helicobacter didelphidarum]|uniref:Lipooligosaccharide biosynthesis glycosyltransferase n=1 Tax=Helicobacter didelphidarum TaxID=2040648 RepID=A0A3D8ILE3_9HELI|nr:glycosyltransferase family 25 protein [Helicobacter didelphidarum]RDU65726.1 lipooligosaccharide biosynthesis glycosyltransferase [Helicobacter didelphidarum]
MKIFIINLERSRDRRRRMQEKIQKLTPPPLSQCQQSKNYEFIFFKATDSKNEELEKYKKHFKPMLCYLLHGRILANSEIACYASHFRLWEECVKLNEPIIVLEDDIYFEDNFFSVLDEIRESKIGFVRLYYLDKRRAKYTYQIRNTHFYWTLKNTNGIQGYYITPHTASKFLAQKWDSPVDIQMEFVARHKVDNIIYCPFCIGEDSTASSSTITSERLTTLNTGNNSYITLKYKIARPFYRFYVQMQRAIFKLFYTPPKMP